MNSSYISIGIWVVVIGGCFIWLWQSGRLLQLRDYVRQTWEELKKCSWPTQQELKGSTLVVIISLALLGAFTYVVDTVFHTLMMVIT